MDAKNIIKIVKMYKTGEISETDAALRLVIDEGATPEEILYLLSDKSELELRKEQLENGR